MCAGALRSFSHNQASWPRFLVESRRAAAAEGRRVRAVGGWPGVVADGSVLTNSPVRIVTSDRHSAGNPVLAAIEARALTLDLARTLERALDRARSLEGGFVIDGPLASDLARAVATARARDLARTLRRALTLAIALDRALVTGFYVSRSLENEADLERARQLTRTLAVALTSSLTSRRARSTPRVLISPVEDSST